MNRREKNRDTVLDYLRQREEASADEILGLTELEVRGAIDDLRDGHLHVNIVRTAPKRFGIKPGKWKGKGG